MIIIIAGSRSITDRQFVYTVCCRAPFRDQITRVYHGGAKGVDTLGGKWAGYRNIPVRVFKPNWFPNGPKEPMDRRAGFKRNQEMIDEGADGLIAVWDGHSGGTADMIGRARRFLPVKNIFVYNLEDEL